MRYLLSNEQYDALKFLAGGHGGGKRRLVATQLRGRTYWFCGPLGQQDGRAIRGLFVRGLVEQVTDLLGSVTNVYRISERGRRLFLLEHCLRVIEPGGLVTAEQEAA